MNWDQVEGQWKEIMGSVREKWAKITDDELKLIAGKKDRLLGKLQARYGKQKEAAEKELDAFIATIKPKQESQKTVWERIYVCIADAHDPACAAVNRDIAELAAQSGLGVHTKWRPRGGIDCCACFVSFGTILKYG